MVGIQADLEGLGVDCTGQTTYEDFEEAVLQIDMARYGVGMNPIGTLEQPRPNMIENLV